MPSVSPIVCIVLIMGNAWNASMALRLPLMVHVVLLMLVGACVLVQKETVWSASPSTMYKEGNV